MFILLTSIGTLPIACTASVWKINAALAAQLADFGDRLEHADFIVRRHDRDENRLVVHGALQVVEIDQAIFLHGQIGHAEAELLEVLAGVEHSLVFGDCRDDVVALLAVHFGDALDGQVVAFGGAGGEDDFFRGRADQLGDALAREFDRFFGGPSERVIAAGCVAELLHEIRKHLFEHARIHRRGRVVIHVYGQLDAVRELRDVHCRSCCGSPSLHQCS